ncbi:TPA: hypothetical protein ACE8FJ_001642, partial [Neisseria gonorrhoeae]
QGCGKVNRKCRLNKASDGIFIERLFCNRLARRRFFVCPRKWPVGVFFCVTCCLLIGPGLRFLFVLNFRRLIGLGFLLILDFICSEGLRWVCLSRLPGIFGR